MSNKGKFIVFEGTDGSGKTTQIELLKKFLETTKIPHIFVREPGGTSVGEKIRDILLDNNNKFTGETEAMLYAASRTELTKEVIIPKLEAGINVFSDRYLLSSLAYQGSGRGLGLEIVYNINKYAIIPDLTIFLNAPISLSMDRKRSQKALDRLESEEKDFHDRVYQGYIEAIENFQFNVFNINANQDKEEIFNMIKSRVLETVRGES